MGNVGKMVENRIIEQQRSDKNYRTTKKVRSKFRYVFFIPSEENRIIEQQGTVNNRTFVLLNFRSIILAPTIAEKAGQFVDLLPDKPVEEDMELKDDLND